MKRESKINPILKIVLLVFIFLVLVYTFGVVYFSRYIYPNTLVNNIDMSFATVSAASEKVKFQDIEIVDRNKNKYVISPEELGFKAEYIEKADITQNSFKWPIEMFLNHEYKSEMDKSVDSEKLKKWIDNSELTKNQVEPKNAEIKKSENGYYIEKEVLGTKLDEEKLYKSIEKAYLSLDNKINLKEEYIEPEVYSKDLEKKQEELAKLYELELTLKLSDGTEEKVEDLEKFVDEEKVEVREEKVKEYVKELKSKYDNIGKTRTFKTTGGEEVQVPPGNFGTQINLDKTSAAIYKSIKDGVGGVVDIVYTTKAKDNGEIKDTYVEISIAKQHMWFYKGGALQVETPIVTGLPGRYSTPKGAWNIWIKEQNRYLRGLNADGSKYKSWVNYWMQIDGTGVGIHDSSWQSSYGSNIYTYRGSHGCINTPLNKAKAIYDNVEKGTPVVVY